MPTAKQKKPHKARARPPAQNRKPATSTQGPQISADALAQKLSQTLKDSRGRGS